jgi:hypothetical protein
MKKFLEKIVTSIQLVSMISAVILMMPILFMIGYKIATQVVYQINSIFYYAFGISCAVFLIFTVIHMSMEDNER